MKLKSDIQEIFSLRLGGIFLLVTLVFFLPYLLRGDGVHVPEADNLDSNIAWYKMLADQGKVWAGPMEMVKGMVGETPRFSYPSGLNLEVLLYASFDPFWAYSINKLLLYLVAFLSMYFLLRRLDTNADRGTIFLMALVWATLSFYPHRGISIAGMPLVALAILNLWEGQKKALSYGLILFYVSYSMAVLAGFFVWGIAVVFVLMAGLYFRQWPKHVFLGLGLWSITYMVQDYQLIYGFFMEKEFISHRNAMVYPGADFSVIHLMKLLSQGNYLGVYHWWGYLPIAVGLLFWDPKKSNYKRWAVILLLTTFIMVVLSILLNLPSMANVMGEVWPALHSFSLTRIVHPAPFFLFLAFGLLILGAKVPFKKALLSWTIALNIFPYQFEWRNMVNEYVPFLGYRLATFREFYAEDLYGELKEYLGDREEKFVGHINIHPAVSAYNGLSSIDGYVQNYRLSHKEKIIKVVKNEIEGNDFLEYHLMDWGNKCYLQHSTYPDMFNAYKWKALPPVQTLNFDFVFLKEQLHVDYLISALPVYSSHLELEKKFQHPDAAWDIYLYAVR